MQTKSRNRWLVCFLGGSFLILLAFYLLFLYKIPYRTGLGIRLNFEKVQTFRSPIKLVLIFEYNKMVILQVNKNLPTINDVLFFSFPESEICEAIGNSLTNFSEGEPCFYVSTQENIYKFDLMGKLVQKFHIVEFQLAEEFIFCNKIDIEGEHLWQLVKSSGEYQEYIMEWNVLKSTLTKKIHKIDLYRNPDPFGRMIIDFGNEAGYYCLDAKELIGNTWINYFPEGLRSDSLVASHAWTSGREDFVSFLDNKYDVSKKITKGSKAKWGSDGYLYFTRGSTQLWRYEPNTIQENPVFCATFFPVYSKFRGPCDLVWDVSRQYMGFLYSIPLCNENEFENTTHFRFGIVLVDCKNYEYIHINSAYLQDLYHSIHQRGIPLSSKIPEYSCPEKDSLPLTNIALFSFKENTDQIEKTKKR